MKKCLLLALLTLFCSAQILAQSNPYCLSNRFSESPIFNNSVVVSDYDLEFGFSNNWLSGQDSLKLNIHYPNKTIDPLAKRPLVVLIHGGLFNQGSKAEFDNYCIQLAERGFVAATIDYRLGWDTVNATYCQGNVLTLYNAMYRAVQDAKAAIRFILDSAPFYRIDEDYVFVGGREAGAITALQVAFLEDSEVLSMYPSSVTIMGGIDVGTNPIMKSFKIKGVLNWDGAVMDSTMMDKADGAQVLSLHGEFNNIIPLDIASFFNCSSAQGFPNLFGPSVMKKRMDNNDLCHLGNYKTSGAKDVFLNQHYQYSLNKSVCFMKQVLCSNCNKGEEWDEQIVACRDVNPLNINNLSILNKISVFPNPAVDLLNIQLNTPGVNLRIYSILGQQMFEQGLHVGNNKLNIAALNAGLYLVEMELNGERILRKVLVE